VQYHCSVSSWLKPLASELPYPIIWWAVFSFCSKEVSWQQRVSECLGIGNMNCRRRYLVSFYCRRTEMAGPSILIITHFATVLVVVSSIVVSTSWQGRRSNWKHCTEQLLALGVCLLFLHAEWQRHTHLMWHHQIISRSKHFKNISPMTSRPSFSLCLSNLNLNLSSSHYSF
jgi:hypothetical protein